MFADREKSLRVRGRGWRTGFIVVATLATMATLPPVASGAIQTPPELANDDWTAPIVVLDDSDAVGAQGIFDDDPHGLIPKTPFVQRYSLDTDHWEVWLCGATTRTMTQVLADLDDAAVGYFGALSGGLYTPSFSAGGTKPGDTSCLAGFLDGTYSTVGTPEGLLIIDPVTGGGYASPGIVCTGTATDCPSIPTTFPGNRRYAVVDEDALRDFPNVAVHELGHTLQWPHSFSGITTWEYDNPIDLMSGNAGNLGEPSYTEPDPYSSLSYNRYQSGWVSTSAVVVADGTYQALTLEPFDVSGTQVFAVKTALDGKFYVLGARRTSAYDPIPASWQGVEVYLVDHYCDEPAFGGVCPGIYREHHQQPPNEYQLLHVLTPGESIEIEGLTITITGATVTGYTVVSDPDPFTSDEPAAPGALAVDTAVGQATITWAEPADGGSPILGYDIEVENRGVGGSTVTDAGLTLAATVTGLVNGDTYRARVRAGNAVGEGDWSSWSVDFIPGTVPSAAGVPAISADVGQLTASWTAASTTSDAIDGYEFELENVTAATISSYDVGVVLTYTVAGLSSDDTYRVKVRAHNITGWGPWSAWSDPASPSASPDTFVDDNDSIFEPDIEWLAAVGITRGCNPPVNDRFCPDDVVTRGQMAAFLVRALGLVDGGSVDFVDDDDSVFESDIERLAAVGITRGCNPPVNDRFCPDDVVTRGQMAAFLRRALG